jgi:protein-tyrosine-phosphatase
MSGPPFRRILLVCTGNTCRSPMATALLERALRERMDPGAGGIEVRSAGLAVASPGAPASANACRALAERGLSLAGHRAMECGAGVLDWADLVLTMTSAQREEVVRISPRLAERTFALREFSSGLKGPWADVRDPIGGDLATYRASAAELEEEAGKLVLLLT